MKKNTLLALLAAVAAFSVGCGSDDKPAAEAAPGPVDVAPGPVDVARTACDAVLEGDYKTFVSCFAGRPPVSKADFLERSERLRKANGTIKVGDVEMEGDIARVMTTFLIPGEDPDEDPMPLVKVNGVWKIGTPGDLNDGESDELDLDLSDLELDDNN